MKLVGYDVSHKLYRAILEHAEHFRRRPSIGTRLFDIVPVSDTMHVQLTELTARLAGLEQSEKRAQPSL